MTLGVEQSGSPATPRLDIGEALLGYAMNPDDFIGTQVFASAKSDRKSGQFQKITRESMLRKGTKVKRAPGGKYERDGYETTPVNFACQERGHENALDESIIALYEYDFDAELHASKLEVRKVVLDQECDIAAAVFDTAVFTTGNGQRTDVVKAWSDPTATVKADIQNAKEAVANRTGEEAGTLILNRTEYRRLVTNTEIVGALSVDVTRSVTATMAALLDILDLKRILVGRAVYNGAKKGQTMTSATKVWPDGFAMVAVTAEPGSPLTVPCLGRSVFWVNDADTDSALIEEYMEAQTRSKVFRARSHADELMLDSFYGQLLDIAG